MPYSASTAFLEAPVEAGIKYIYGNFGSDHPAILESLAEAKKTGRKIPEVLTVPIEQVGLHVAMGYAHVGCLMRFELMVDYWKAAMCNRSR